MNHLQKVGAVALILSCILSFKCESLPGLGGLGGGAGASDAEMADLGAAAFEDLKKKIPVSNDPRANAYVRCVANSIISITQDPTGVKDWEIVVFQEPSANAFALPGGKIGVHTGLFPVATNQDMLAAVLGHEVGHVIKRHGASRMQSGTLAGVGVGMMDKMISADNPLKGTIMAGIGLGAQYGVVMPFGRSQESEADLVGLDLMAKAGFDPTQSIMLWKNMSAAGGSKTPQFMSTHPSSETRIKELQANMNKALSTRAQAQSLGKNPACRL
ncbi:MAG: M48 family metallopeptidase [Leptospirales bacterium]|nr:M48 family metallopeptidase [Leptospirales bacterium]